MNRAIIVLITAAIAVALSGCAVILEKRNAQDLDRIDLLSTELDQERNFRQELEQAKIDLERRLSREIDTQDVSVSLDQNRMTITLADAILFAPGQAEIRSEAKPLLNDVAQILQGQVPDRQIAIAGHTDNQPIEKSKNRWQSNWELSAARAASVLDYLTQEKKISPERMMIIGYAHYHPVASNATEAGRQKNRRVEITILPDLIPAPDQTAGNP